MAHQLFRGLLHEICQAEWFADKTQDISRIKQPFVSLRWVNNAVYEDVIGLVQVERTDAATLTDMLKVFLFIVVFI